jgi:CubicO group peptidase (beta-lactamase class C family)
MKTFRQLALILISVIIFSCDQKKPVDTDPVARSLEYQSWETTQQPEGTAAYLGVGPVAKCLCTAVFESKRKPGEAFANGGKIILPEEYADLIDYEINYEAKQAIVFMGDSVKRSATYYGDQGCILDSPGGLKFTPVKVTTSLPPAGEIDWPMGDRVQPVPETYDKELLEAAGAEAMDPRALTAAFLVIHKGHIIIEKYGEGVNKDMQLESWSMGKSLTATLIGRLIQMGKLTLDQKAPLNEWQREGDPRGEITIRNLLNMSSGLRFPAHRDSAVNAPLALLTHMYVYTGAINVFDFAVNRPLEFAPGTMGLYRNSDPLTLGYILRSIVEAEGRNYWTWPQEELFDKIGIRRQLLETDPWGNFIMSGYDFGTARNWGRIGMLYLNDGVWNEERLLPEGFAEFVSTPAPGWRKPEYGGLFWLNKIGTFSVPEDAFYAAGAGGQVTIIVPSLDLVVVRMGHSDGAEFMRESLNKALGRVVAVVGE